MENAIDALKMGAAMLLFIGAISLAVMGLTRAKQTAGEVLDRSDDKAFYDTEDINILRDRTVSIETVIPTMYAYFKEGYTILFYTGTTDGDGRLIGEITPLTLYYSESLPSRLALSNLINEDDNKGGIADYNNERHSRAIYGLDANDEESRQEPWLHDELHAKMFVQSLINNATDDDAPIYDMSRNIYTRINHRDNINNKLTMNFGFDGGLIDTVGGKLSSATDSLFIERIGVYNELATNENDRGTTYSTDKSVIEFSNNETMENEEGTQKRVIQYIYVGEK